MILKIGLNGKQNAGCFWLGFAILTSPVGAQPSVTTFLLNGVAAPDGNGVFSSAEGPVLNDASQLSFIANLSNTSGGGQSSDQIGIFRLTGPSLVKIARGLDAAPGNTDMFGAFATNPPPMNQQGVVAFTALRNGAVGIAGLYTGSGGSPNVIVDHTDTPPDGNGTFAGISDLAINPLNQVAFIGGLTGTTPANTNSGVYRGDGNFLVEIVRRQDAAPDGNGVFTGFRVPALNTLGEVAFAGDLSAPGATKGVFRGMEGSLTQIARDGMPAPGLGGGINGQFDGLGNDVSLNNVGQVAFVSTLSDTSGGNSENAGLFRGDSEFSTVMIAHKGQAPAEGNGVFNSFSPPTINNFGTVAFRSNLAGSTGASLDNDGIYVGDDFGVTTVLRDGTPAPNGDGTFELSTSLPVINDAGQVAFEASFRNGSPGAGNGLYFWDKSAGLFEVARIGNAFLGSTITELGWAQRTGAGDLEHSGLNSAAQMAYSFRLADSTEGLAIWSANLNAIPTGDYDGDGDVDGNDFLQWQRGQSPNALSPVDLAVWHARYGKNVLFSDAQGVLQSVPEPQSLALLAMVGFLVGLRRKSSPQC